MLQNVPGTWGIGGFKLPDFGVTELVRQILGKTASAEQTTKYNNPNVIRATIGSTAPATVNKQTAPQITTQVSTAPVPSGGSPQPSGGSPSGGDGGGGGQQASSGPSIQDIINSAYDAEQGVLNQAEGNVKGQAQTATDQLKTENQNANTSIQNQQNLNLTDLGNREVQSKQNYSQGFTQAKQLLQDLQNRQSAQLAAGGGANSSSSLALNEQFGKTAFGSIGNLRTSLQNSLDAITQERSKVNQFFTDKITSLQSELQRGLNDINSGLQNALVQIGQSRAQSTQAKASATLDAWNNYLTQRSNLNLQAMNFAQQLAAWQVAKNGNIDAAMKYVTGNTPQTDVNAGSFNPSDVAGSISGRMNQGLVAPNAPIPVPGLQASATNTTDEQKRQLELLGILPSSVSSGLTNLPTTA